MGARFLAFGCWLAAGGVAGWLLAADTGAAAGLAAGALGWFVLESSRAARVLRWLRAPDEGRLARMGGAWGEAGERALRIRAAGVMVETVRGAGYRLTAQPQVAAPGSR